MADIINVAIIDDEKIQVELLKKYVKDWAREKNIRVRIEDFYSAESFDFSFSMDRKYDILLLDIQMPGQSGIELAKKIRKEDDMVNIIFITAITDYIQVGYDVSAINYLVKPIKEKKLYECLDKAVLKIPKEEKTILINADGETYKIKQSDIIYIEAFAHSIDINAVNGKYTARKSIGEIQKELSNDLFVRCHRSYIVSLKYIKRIGNNELELDNGDVIPVSRKQYSNTNMAFIRYLGVEEMNSYKVPIIIGIILVLIFILFCLFKHILLKLLDKHVANYQNDLMTKHYNEVENIYKQMRAWKHDYHNHIQVMKAYLELNKYDDMEKYLNELDEDLTNIDTVLKTGNVMVDAILNSKLSLAMSQGININAKASVPKNLQVSDIDLCVIIGNLMDNAMEAAVKIENKEDRFIRVYIREMKEQLYISITNSVGGEIKKTSFGYISTKLAKNHGFGLKRVDAIVAKYNGFINRQNEEGVFATEIILPL
jgi:DNA-binding LytR/AlgR family response regulator